MAELTAHRGSRRRRVAVSVAILIAAAGAILIATPAHAAPGDCVKGNSCLYSGYDYGNDWLQNGGTLKLGYCIDDLGEHWYDNMTSSFFNNGRTDVVWVFSQERQKGSRQSFKVNTGSKNLGAWNDKMSSVYFVSQLENVGRAICY